MEEFRGTDRFRIRHRLGEGAFGVVYEAHDLERDSTVALKLLRRAEPAALYRFKQEFRALADVSHPNLVTLYELLSDGESWFFTMQLVQGVSFLEHVWIDAGRARSMPPEGLDIDDGLEVTEDDLSSGLDTAALAGPFADPSFLSPRARVVIIDPERLRRAAEQLAVGISALHAAGKLHRDIKPSNVLVSQEGRVVILDFGLVRELAPDGALGDEVIAGTPPYMSPEQILGGEIRQASDWYNMGALLYEALTGRHAFTGTTAQIVQEKCRAEPLPPSKVATGVPPDLDALCLDLLKRDPDARPTGPEILRRLRQAPGSAVHVTARISTGEPLLVGRDRQRAAVLAAFDRVRAEKRPVTLYVKGSSGMGKTALVRQALDDLRVREGRDLVVLSGRCYERESVPFKALDSLVDALSHYLESLSPGEIADVLPQDILAIARLFPVLSRVDAVEAAERQVLQILDRRELRRRAFAAFRDLLTCLARRHPLVIFIDDLQWGDVDSAALLSEVFRPPDPPPLLFIGCYRTEEAETSPFLRALLPLASTPAWGAEVQDVGTFDLDPEEARALALELLGDSDPAASQKASEIARDSRGSPYFVEELVRFAKRRDPRPQSPSTLDDVIHARVSLLPEGARRLLELLAISGRPLPVSLVKHAAGVEKEEHETMAALRGARLIRTRRAADDRDEVEAYHDRIRETLVARLSPDDRKGHHRRLARALETRVGVDPERLAVHLQGAGEHDRAAEYAERAGAEAMRVLAFDRAARLFGLALDLQASEAAGRQALRVKLGDALASAGRGAEASEAYLEAVPGAEAASGVELMRRAAQQLLISGHIDRGLTVLRDVLAKVGIRPAEAPWRVLLSILVHRLFLAVRGLSFRERDAVEIPVPMALRIDTCWSAAEGLGLVDTVRGAEFQARHLLLALRSGEPYRVARALAMDIPYSATAGVRARRRTAERIEAAARVARRVAQPHTDGLVTFARGAAAYLEGNWSASRVHCEDAEEILRDRCAGAVWALDATRIFLLRSLVYLGQINELSVRLAALVTEARERGERLSAMYFRASIAYVLHLAEDRADLASQGIAEALEQWPRKGFDLPHYWALHGQVETYLYEGRGLRAWALVREQWPALSRSLLLQTQLLFIVALDYRARSALCAASDPTVTAAARESFLVAAESDARRIERERADWAAPLAWLTRGRAAAIRGQTREALTCLADAEDGFARHGMALHLAACRRRRGELMPEADVVASADEWLRGQQVRDPARMTAMLAP